MNTPSFQPLRLAAVAVVLLAAFTAFADAGGVGRPSGGGSTFEWDVKVTGHDRIQLTVVSPDGTVFTREFTPGRNPSFRLSDIEGTVEDGAYTYELRVVPKISADVKKKLDNARAQNDEAAARKLMRQAGLDQPLVQSGTITIVNGSIVDPNAVESNANDNATSAASSGRAVTSNAPSGLTPVVNDQVIPDDLIVQGSACVGFDCVNNENFGFDTIRLKENNLRIKFEDTSTGTFPTTDWQLTANDSASGGSNKFSIEDITGVKVPFTVTAGAATNSIFVDSTGRVGFRTSTPVLDLHVATSNTPAMRLEQNNLGGFTAQTWDVAGNEANFFIRDVTSGSRLPFRIRPGAPTSSIDINAEGRVGIRTASPAFDVDIRGDGVATSDQRIAVGANPVAGPGLIFGHGGGAFGLGGSFMHARGNASSVAPNPALRFMTAETVRMIIDNEGFIGIGAILNPAHPIHHANGAHLTAGGVWTNASSRDFKQDITALDPEEAAAALAQLEPVKYAYKADPNERHVGFIAEDVPDIVATPDRKGLSSMDVVALLTKVVQEQQKTIDELSKKVDELSQRKP